MTETNSLSEIDMSFWCPVCHQNCEVIMSFERPVDSAGRSEAEEAFKNHKSCLSPDHESIISDITSRGGGVYASTEIFDNDDYRSVPWFLYLTNVREESGEILCDVFEFNTSPRHVRKGGESVVFNSMGINKAINMFVRFFSSLSQDGDEEFCSASEIQKVLLGHVKSERARVLADMASAEANFFVSGGIFDIADSDFMGGVSDYQEIAQLCHNVSDDLFRMRSFRSIVASLPSFA